MRDIKTVTVSVSNATLVPNLCELLTVPRAFNYVKMEWAAGAGKRRIEDEEHAGRDDEKVELHHLIRGHQVLDEVPEPITQPDL